MNTTVPHETQHRSYKHPPIVEAILDVQLKPAVSSAEFSKLKSKLSGKFPTALPMKAIEIMIGPGGAIKSPEREAQSLRMTSAEGNDILMLQEGSLTLSRLAPYDGWPELSARFREVFTSFRSVVGHREATRLGLRYINRIDIPHSEHTLDMKKVLRVFLSYPSELTTAINHFSTRFEFFDETTGLTSIVQTALAQPALIDHISLLLDVDVIRDKDIPANPERLFELLEEMRILKNRIFEACITDFLRERFDL